MSKQEHVEASEVLLLSRIAHVVERAGLSLAGAMCGTFVAAQLTRTDPARFDTVGFIVAMVLTGMIGFYLGIDIPRLRAPPASAAMSVSAPRIVALRVLRKVGIIEYLTKLLPLLCKKMGASGGNFRAASIVDYQSR